MIKRKKSKTIGEVDKAPADESNRQADEPTINTNDEDDFDDDFADSDDDGGQELLNMSKKQNWVPQKKTSKTISTVKGTIRSQSSITIKGMVV